MIILSKVCKPDSFESQNSKTWLYQYFRFSFQYCWIWIFLWFKCSWHSCSMWEKLEWLNRFWQFLCEGLSSFDSEGFCYSREWSSSFCEGGISTCMRSISIKVWGLFTSFRLALLHSVSYFFFLYWSPSVLCEAFYIVSSNIENVLSIDQSPMY